MPGAAHMTVAQRGGAMQSPRRAGEEQPERQDQKSLARSSCLHEVAFDPKP